MGMNCDCDDVAGDQRLLRKGHCIYTGHRGQSLLKFAMQRDVPSRTIACGRRLDVEQQQMSRAEPQVRVTQIDQRTHKQPGAYQQEHGQRNLYHDDGLSGESFAAPCGGLRAVFEAGTDVYARWPATPERGRTAALSL